jgi:hypothetical protein
MNRWRPVLHPVDGLQICQKSGLAKMATFTLADGALTQEKP